MHSIFGFFSRLTYCSKYSFVKDIRYTIFCTDSMHFIFGFFCRLTYCFKYSIVKKIRLKFVCKDSLILSYELLVCQEI